MNQHHWGPEEGLLLQSLRLEAGIDDFVFAQLNTVSLAQLKELETGEGNSFYNPQIKRNTGLKLLKKLGHTSLPFETVSLVQPAPKPPLPSPKLQVNTGGFFSQPTVWALAAVLLAAFAVIGHDGWTQSNLRSLPDERRATLEPLPNAAAAAAAAASSAPEPINSAPESGLTPQPLTSPVPQADHNPAPESHDSSMVPDEPVASVSCAAQHRQDSASHTPTAPLRPGHYIYFEALESAQLCVLDAQNKLTTTQLDAGMKRRINGEAPFLVHSSNWNHLKMFYQGRRVQTGETVQQHMVLNSEVFEP